MTKHTLRKLKFYVILNEAVKAAKTFIHNKKEVRRWLKSEKPVPPPHAVKQSIVKIFLQRYPASVFVETGTYHGDMVYALRSKFSKIYSIELDQTLYRKAVKRFSQMSHIEIIPGDSAAVLPILLNRIKVPALFWLDGHYSGEATARGALETPILQELLSIFNHLIKNHVVLIDDARCFTGVNGYPALEQLRTFVLEHRPDMSFVVEDDVIRVYPAVNGKVGLGFKKPL